MMSPELAGELIEALTAKEAAREEWARREVAAAEAKAAALDARKAWRATCDRVDEIEGEIRTGLSGLPLIDAAGVVEVRPADGGPKRWAVHEREAGLPGGAGRFLGGVVASDEAGARSGAARAWPESAAAGFVVSRAAHLESPERFGPVEADEVAPIEGRRFVPTTAADREPVRVAKGSGRAAAEARR